MHFRLSPWFLQPLHEDGRSRAPIVEMAESESAMDMDDMSDNENENDNDNDALSIENPVSPKPEQRAVLPVHVHECPIFLASTLRLHFSYFGGAPLKQRPSDHVPPRPASFRPSTKNIPLPPPSLFRSLDAITQRAQTGPERPCLCCFAAHGATYSPRCWHLGCALCFLQQPAFMPFALSLSPPCSFSVSAVPCTFPNIKAYMLPMHFILSPPVYS